MVINNILNLVSHIITNKHKYKIIILQSLMKFFLIAINVL